VTFRTMSHIIGQSLPPNEIISLGLKWELSALSDKYPISYDPVLLGSIRPKSTIVPGEVGRFGDTSQQQRFVLRGEDLVDADESEPLDDRDTLSHHTHHKDDTVPMDDRDFGSVHTHHEEDPSVPLDDRDFDSHHTERPRVVVGTDEQKMRNLERSNYKIGELDDLEYIDNMNMTNPLDEDNDDGIIADKN